MKKYVFENPKSCLKFLTYLNVKVEIPKPRSVFATYRPRQVVSYWVETEGTQCIQAYMELQSSNQQTESYVFYHSLSEQQPDQLRQTIDRLRQAYQQI